MAADRGSNKVALVEEGYQVNKSGVSHFIRSLLLFIGLGLPVGGLSPGVAADVQTPAAVGTTTRISVSSSGAGGNDQSVRPSISDNGRYVVFESLASNLVTGDTNDKWDIFVRDRQTNVTERVSVAANGAQGNEDSIGANISADGRYIVFTSWATNLIAGKAYYESNVYLKDRQTGQVELISASSTGAADGCAGHYSAISNDSRYVAFYSCNDDLVSGDTNGRFDVYLRDRWTGKTRRVSDGLGGKQGDDRSWGPVGISADGKEVFFHSWATNLVSNDKNETLDAFVHNWETGVTEILSISTSGEQGNSDTGGSVPSADGNIVTLNSNASTLVADDTNNISDVFVRDRTTGETRRVSVASDGSQVYGSYLGNISPDGRFVAFISYSSRLVTQDTNGVPDVFVHDIYTGRTNRVSISSNGTQANDESGYAMDIALDGRAVAFVSKATNLVSGGGDTNNTWDVFVHEYAPCYSLIIYHSGNGNDPATSPGRSVGCEPATFYGGNEITLTAKPAFGHRVKSWSGTNNNNSTSNTNTVTMPASDHAVGVTYEIIPGATFLATIPLTLFMPSSPCFAGPNEVEPNNSAAEANGPLCPNTRTIYGWPGDQFDYFMLDTAQPGRVAATLSNHYGGGTQLALYFGGCCDPGQRVDNDSTPKDGLHVEHSAGQRGRYYIVIYTETPKPNETRPYTLQLEFP